MLCANCNRTRDLIADEFCIGCRVRSAGKRGIRAEFLMEELGLKFNRSCTCFICLKPSRVLPDFDLCFSCAMRLVAQQSDPGLLPSDPNPKPVTVTDPHGLLSACNIEPWTNPKSLKPKELNDATDQKG
jgi:hypothetical protein